MAPPITCECGSCQKCKRREYMRGYYRKNAERVREQCRHNQLRTRTPLMRHLEYLKREKTDPHKMKARNLVNRAVKHGRLVRGVCELATRGDCRGRMEGHHEDYDKPLEVRWLCRRHHAELHRTVLTTTP